MASEVWHVLWFTLAAALLSTTIILVPGVAMGWLLAKHQWRGKSIVETIVALPLVVPPVASGLILLKLLGRRGPIGSFFYNILGVEIVFTWKAVIIALAVMSFPLLVRSARLSFESINPRLEQIARTLGASKLDVFFTITLPLAVRGIVAGALLSYARALGEFGATILIAGNIPGKTTILSVAIYQNVQLGQDNEALALMCCSLAFAFGSVWLSERFFGARKDQAR